MAATVVNWLARLPTSFCTMSAGWGPAISPVPVAGKSMK
jgi:hypothetical protein